MGLIIIFGVLSSLLTSYTTEALKILCRTDLDFFVFFFLSFQLLILKS